MMTFKWGTPRRPDRCTAVVGRAAVGILTALACLGTATGAGARPSPSALFKASYRLISARVSTNWDYNWSWTDPSSGGTATGTGGEVASLRLLRADSSLDHLGIFSAYLKGTLAGSYSSQDAVGTMSSCPQYGLNPSLLGEQLQLNSVALPGHRVEINAGLDTGQQPSQVSAFQQEVDAVSTACGETPPNIGYGLMYAPEPNNVHTSQCAGVSDGCEIFPLTAFTRSTVTVQISGSEPLKPGATVIPQGGTGQDTFTWSIAVVLKAARPGR